MFSPYFSFSSLFSSPSPHIALFHCDSLQQQIDDNSDDEDKGVRPLMKVPVALVTRRHRARSS